MWKELQIKSAIQILNENKFDWYKHVARMGDKSKKFGMQNL